MDMIYLMGVLMVCLRHGIVLTEMKVHVHTAKPICYQKRTSVGSCFDRYAVIPGHINCVYESFHGISSKQTADDVDTIVAEHNNIRVNVIPPAANMLEINYDHGLSDTANKRSRSCVLSARTNWYTISRPGSYITGENALLSDVRLTWSDVIQKWALERQNFTYNMIGNDPDVVGNYTQIIWAETAVVGCARSLCGSQYFYVCHYAPRLDDDRIDKPYEQLEISLTNVTPYFVFPSQLLGFRGMLCLGGSTLNLTTCVCDCIDSVEMYFGNLCELKCIPNGDDPRCNKPPYTKDKCGICLHTMFYCPWMCHVCPYAGKSYKQGSARLPWEEGLPDCTTTTSTTTQLQTGRIYTTDGTTQTPVEYLNTSLTMTASDGTPPPSVKYVNTSLNMTTSDGTTQPSAEYMRTSVTMTTSDGPTQPSAEYMRTSVTMTTSDINITATTFNYSDLNMTTRSRRDFSLDEKSTMDTQQGTSKTEETLQNYTADKVTTESQMKSTMNTQLGTSTANEFYQNYSINKAANDSQMMSSVTAVQDSICPHLVHFITWAVLIIFL